MNTHTTLTGRSRPQPRSWGRFAGIVALYALLGPFVGALGVNGLFTAFSVGSEIVNGDIDDIARLLWGGLVVGGIFTVIIACAFGIVSAAGGGLAVAIGDLRKGGVSWSVALTSALAFWLLTSVAVATVAPPQGLGQWVGALFVAHLLATAMCTWATRRLFR